MKPRLLSHRLSVSYGSQAAARAGTRLAFTLIELLAVLGIISLLAATMVPTLAGSRFGSQAFRCINNNRQLCSAWRMYADDNHDTVVYASDDGRGPSNPNNRYAWTWTHLDFSPNNRINWDTNLDIVQRPLWLYTAGDASIYRCPSDDSFVLVNGAVKPRVRSFSMNLFVGGFAPKATSAPGSPGTAGGFPGTDGYRIFSKTTDFTVLPPGAAFVFLDERPEIINWGNYATDMHGYRPHDPALYEFSQDFPGILHNFGGCFSFVDGRAEIHRWFDPRTAPSFSLGLNIITTVHAPRDPDVAWLQDHSTRHQ